MEKMKITFEMLERGDFMLPFDDAKYIGYKRCYNCALDIVEETLIASGSFVFVSYHARVNELFRLAEYCLDLDMSEIDNNDGRIAFFDWCYTNKVIDKIYSLDSVPVILNIVKDTQEAVLAQNDSIRTLARVMAEQLIPMMSQLGPVDNVQETGAAAEKLLGAVAELRELTNPTEKKSEQKPTAKKIPVLNFAKKM